jgi:hypothetical protein
VLLAGMLTHHLCNRQSCTTQCDLCMYAAWNFPQLHAHNSPNFCEHILKCEFISATGGAPGARSRQHAVLHGCCMEGALAGVCVRVCVCVCVCVGVCQKKLLLAVTSVNTAV